MAKKGTGKISGKSKDRKSSNVPGTYLGFSLQTTRFLVRTLKASPGDLVCLEVFEDVGVERADGTRIAEQNKSNLAQNPLSDRAVDFWKTLRIWTDACCSAELDPDKTFFEIYTSNPAGGEIAESFRDAKTVEKALAAIEKAETTLKQMPADGGEPLGDAVRVHFQKVMAADRSVLARIVSRFSFESGVGSPQDELKPLVLQKLVGEDFCDDLLHWALGWVKRETDRLLERGAPARVEYKSFHDAAVNFMRNHDRNDILRSFAGAFGEEEIQSELGIRTYVRQLDLIEMDDEEIFAAINDFLMAAVDRTIWSERGMISENALDRYSEELCRSWRNRQKRVEILHKSQTEVNQGQLLYVECMEHTSKLDDLGTPSHFSRGSWHALADDQLVGWHPKYKDELTQLGGGEASKPGKAP